MTVCYFKESNHLDANSASTTDQNRLRQTDHESLTQGIILNVAVPASLLWIASRHPWRSANGPNYPSPQKPAHNPQYALLAQGESFGALVGLRGAGARRSATLGLGPVGLGPTSRTLTVRCKTPLRS